MSEQDLQRQLDDNKESINKVSSLVENLAENHIAHLTNNVNDVQIILAEIKSDLKWIKIIGAFLILQAITVIIKLFVK